MGGCEDALGGLGAHRGPDRGEAVGAGHSNEFAQATEQHIAEVLAGGLVAVVPITSRSYGLRSEVKLDSNESGLTHADRGPVNAHAVR